jgi:hypothetical protein
MWTRRALHLVVGGCLATNAVVGVRALRHEIVVDFRYAPSRMFDAAHVEMIRRIDAVVPPEVPILLVCREDDIWLNRLWQRALYPRMSFVVNVEHPSAGKDLHALSKKFGIGYALAVGRPPANSEFVWQIAFPPLPGYRPAYWLGSLRR